MKVKDVIAALEKCDPEADLFCGGLESRRSASWPIARDVVRYKNQPAVVISTSVVMRISEDMEKVG